MTAELWDLTDVTGAPTGRTHRRGDPIPPGFFHVVASVCAVRADGRILVTQRAATKDHPLDWEIPAGSALAGETSAEGAVRELREETGVAVSVRGVDLVGRCVESSALFDLYVTSVEPDVVVEIDPEEVADSRWVTLDELDGLFASGAMASPWIPRMRDFRDRLGEMVGARADGAQAV